ncbi:MAG: ATP-binding cassette domain-containing protein [Eubacteriales bacterium]
MIQFQNVSFRYASNGDKYSVKDLDLEIAEGEVVVLCGLSGCGKTTVTRLINGLAPHFYEGGIKGNVIVDGKNTKEIELSEFADTCGSVFQNPKSQFFNTDTTGELAFGCENLSFPKEKTAERLRKTIEEFSLEMLMDRDIFKLSGGEKQQIACGSIYAAEPKIYVLDEPSSNMDAEAIERLKAMIQKLKEEGNTIIIAEHRLYFLLDVADRFIYFADGELRECFTPEELKNKTDSELKEYGLRVTRLEDVKQRQDMAVSEDVITVSGVLCTRGKKTVLEIEELTIPKQSVVAIIGENGAGKSTFAEIFSGRLKAKCEIVSREDKLKSKERTKKSYMMSLQVA